MKHYLVTVTDEADPQAFYHIGAFCVLDLSKMDVEALGKSIIEDYWKRCEQSQSFGKIEAGQAALDWLMEQGK